MIVAGINERGDGFFIPNDLVASPLADEGIDEFVITADIDFFEGYGLGGNDRWVFERDIASIFASGDAGNDVLKSNSNVAGGEVALVGGSGRDSISIEAPDADIVIAEGNGGRDKIFVQAPNANSVVVHGGNGHDRIRVSARDAAIVEVLGERGRDRLDVHIGRDTAANIDGGPGRDSVRVTPSPRQEQRRHRYHSPTDPVTDEDGQRHRRGNEQVRGIDSMFADLGRRQHPRF